MPRSTVKMELCSIQEVAARNIRPPACLGRVIEGACAMGDDLTHRDLGPDQADAGQPHPLPCQSQQEHRDRKEAADRPLNE